MVPNPNAPLTSFHLCLHSWNQVWNQSKFHRCMYCIWTRSFYLSISISIFSKGEAGDDIPKHRRRCYISKTRASSMPILSKKIPYNLWNVSNLILTWNDDVLRDDLVTATIIDYYVKSRFGISSFYMPWSIWYSFRDRVLLLWYVVQSLKVPTFVVCLYCPWSLR